MILLDTNVISEPLKREPSSAVLAWLDSQAVETLFLSTINLAELRFGIARLPDGRRKQGLRRDLDERLVPLFAGRILPFGSEAASVYAQLRVRAQRAGRAVGTADAYIASIAAAHGLYRCYPRHWPLRGHRSAGC